MNTDKLPKSCFYFRGAFIDLTVITYKLAMSPTVTFYSGVITLYRLNLNHFLV